MFAQVEIISFECARWTYVRGFSLLATISESGSLCVKDTPLQRKCPQLKRSSRWYDVLEGQKNERQSCWVFYSANLRLSSSIMADRPSMSHTADRRLRGKGQDAWQLYCGFEQEHGKEETRRNAEVDTLQAGIRAQGSNLGEFIS